MGQNSEKGTNEDDNEAPVCTIQGTQLLHPYSLGISQKRHQILPIFQGFYTKKNSLTLEQLFFDLDTSNRSELGIIVERMHKDDIPIFFDIIAAKYPDLVALSMAVSSPDVDDVGVCGALQKLIERSNLQYLSIDTMAPEASLLWQSVCRGIKSNNTIKELAVNRCYSFKDEGLIALCDSLMTNTSVEILRIDRCHLSGEGFKALSNVLKVNTTLRHIFAADNSEYDVLEESLEHNTTLLSLDIISSAARNPQIERTPTKFEAFVDRIMERNNKLVRIRSLLAPMSVLMINIKHHHHVLPLELWIHIFSYVQVEATWLDGLMLSVSRGVIENCLASQTPIRYRMKRRGNALDVVILE